MTGEQHERAVEAMAFERFMAAYERDVRAREVAEKHWRQVSQGVRDAFLVPARRDIDAYLASLREQGVVLADLSEVVEWLFRHAETMHTSETTYHMAVKDAAAHALYEFSERRFGGNERSE